MSVDHEAEAKRYDRLAKEAHNQTTSAKPPEYYEKKAAEHRKALKDTMKEHKAVTGLAVLVESELDKAQVVIAAQSIVGKLQKMAEDLAKIEADDIMPMLDTMQMTFGAELTDRFNEVVTAKVRETIDSLKSSKDAITHEVGRLENQVNGDETNDLGMEGGDDFGADETNDLAGEGDDEFGLGGGEPTLDAGADVGGEEEAPAEANPLDDLDAEFDAAGDNTAAGRAKKESVERNIKALSESRNPDRLIFETFRRTLRESKNATLSARAVAAAFAIDFADVVTIVKEGKTFKDQKDNSNKNKDFKQDRKDKKRDRPSDLDESKNVDECEMEEGKTYKDQRDKSNKDKDYKQDRKDKKRDRPSDLDEAVFPDAGKPKKPAVPFGKKPNDEKVKPKKEIEEAAVKVVTPKKTSEKPFAKPVSIKAPAKK